VRRRRDCSDPGCDMGSLLETQVVRMPAVKNDARAQQGSLGAIGIDRSAGGPASRDRAIAAIGGYTSP